ncbi:MAG: hypothetical protein A4E44_02256 [Methanosaeta sp. PtaB.Bin018]|nr:DUF1887 family protein [Methanothrix sp.]OPX74041.1 MAG: hypothetical protein A4E44_02256 [Methanosaeta sp. PtaB.Bin018]OPY47065.1 MAG: hypothetical protein A4E46_00654 [Methanosaeta sp. PtaU1.Bin016]HOV51313.1 DUF1887 family CARF protein [Methanothrix sp.]
MNLLLCLISHQHVPNLLPVHELRPDWLILLVTKPMEEAANNLIKALAIGGLDYLTRYDMMDLGDPDSLDRTKQVLKAAYELYPDADWTVNLTGGTKPMSIAAYEFFKGRARMIYVSERDQSKAIDLSGGSPIPLNHKISPQEFIAGYGFDVFNPEAIRKNEERATRWFDLAVEIAARGQESDIRGFLGKLFCISQSKEGRNRGLVIDESDELYIMDTELRTKIASTFALSFKDWTLSGTLDKYAVRFFTGGWLEVFSWGMLKMLEGRGLWDCRLGVQVGKKGQKLENDLDAVFMTDQALRIVECKSGGQEQDRRGDNTLYKIEAIRKQLGAIKVKSYLVTTSNNIIDPETKNVREHLATRAKHYDCTIIDPEKIFRIAQMMRSADPGVSEKISELFNIIRRS